jgi:hypothetical protein
LIRVVRRKNIERTKRKIGIAAARKANGTILQPVIRWQWRPMSEGGHLRRFWHVRCTSAYPPLATEERTS